MNRFSRQTYRGLDITNPIELAHPLNVGLIACYMAPPNSGWRGGNKLRNLCRHRGSPTDATLTNLTLGTAWGGSRGRTGGYGSIQGNGTNGHGDITRITTGTSFTYAIWGRATSTVDFSVLWGWDFNSTPGTLYRVSSTALQYWSGGSGQNIGLSPANNVWFHVVVVKSGTAYTFYSNGEQSGTGTTTNWSHSAAQVRIMYDNGAGDPAWTGQSDDFRIYDQALSANEVESLYLDSIRGYPESMRWLSPRKFFATEAPPATPATFNSAWTQQANIFLGCGVNSC